jgi:hypothetical protein
MTNSEQDLEEAERHILEAEMLVAEQKKVLDELTRDGHETASAKAKALLETFTKTLTVMKRHRDLMLSNLAGRHGPELVDDRNRK